MKLDHWVGKETGMGQRAARAAILAGRVAVDGETRRDWAEDLDRFRRIEFDGHLLGDFEPELYFMVHKPAGVVSATKDQTARTVVDLIADPERHRLHVAGRLDRSSTGLVLLTNNGNWSKPLMGGHGRIEKAYHVQTAEIIPERAVAAFAHGFWFATEGHHTRPASLQILGPHLAEVILTEGRYHQIKRMFHRVGCRVTNLHRFRIGHLSLDPELAIGQSRPLTRMETQAALGENNPLP